MISNLRSRQFKHPVLIGMSLGLVGALGANGLRAEVAQAPLSSETEVVGNLILMPSTEWSVVTRPANAGEYTYTGSYGGYFDSAKCYRYVYTTDESGRHFEPVGPRVAEGCLGAQWDGRYLNWVSAQLIDPLRQALTGGYRVVDTPDETWLEKADHAFTTDELFPARRIPEGVSTNSTLVNQLTPANWSELKARVYGLGAKMYFTATGQIDSATSAIAYDPGNASHLLQRASGNSSGDESVIYEVSMRVKVCVPSAGLEANCVRYSQGFKPEGLLQKYSSKLRYSVFSQINNGSTLTGASGGMDHAPDGGVLRARQKFIAPSYPQPFGPPLANSAAEWDAVTGIHVSNPDSADAVATGAGIQHSGVLNYLNKFGQMKTGRSAKSENNVSELYYAAVRYMRHIGNVNEFSALSSDPIIRHQQADGFPVIQQWEDPLIYRCQNNAVLGIGDTNTWRDKNLPGDTSAAGEIWPKPTQVAADMDYDVIEAMKVIWQLQGRSLAEAETLAKASSHGPASQYNSAYIAALAYRANTTDLRPAGAKNALEGLQTLRTFWVDVSASTTDLHRNQYVLATRYGGSPPGDGYQPFPSGSWNPYGYWNVLWGDLLENIADSTVRRPKTYFLAPDATRMTSSLEQAFSMISQPKQRPGSTLAAGYISEPEVVGHRVSTRFFSTSYRPGSWAGDLTSYTITPASPPTSQWSAAAWLDYDKRETNTFTNQNGKLVNFEWSQLDDKAKAALKNSDVVSYLRGNRTKDGLDGFRRRTSSLGAIINSAPILVGVPNRRKYHGRQFVGADDYPKFAISLSGRGVLSNNTPPYPAVFVGANDGRLHAFNAFTGQSLFSFVPRTVITEKLYAYTQEGYEHRYSVDGELTVADVFFKDKGWRTVLVGTLGRGGRGVYALDVTHTHAPELLWEVGHDKILELGAVIGKPMIAQVANGEWRVVFGNGPDSKEGNSALISIDLAQGEHAVIKLDDSGIGAAGAQPWDADNDGFSEIAYVGDLGGGLYRVNLIDNTSVRLFSARQGGAAQPISSTPLITRNPADGSTWVFQGTGALLERKDLSDTRTQSWYGLRDRGQSIGGRNGLSVTRITAETAGGGRVIDKKVAAGQDGWVIDLTSPSSGPRGERMIVSNQFSGRALLGTTRIPDASDPCNPAGSGYQMAIDPFTGGRLDNSFFDMDGDGMVGNAGDLLPGSDGVPTPSSGYLVQQGSNALQHIILQDGMHSGWLGGTGEDGSVWGVVTNPIGNRVRRVGWRELLLMKQGDRYP